MSQRSNELKQRATQAILSHAVFRLESALTISLTLVLVVLFPQPLPWWKWWYWLVLGIVGEALVIYTSVSDEMTSRKVVADLLWQSFDTTAGVADWVGSVFGLAQRLDRYHNDPVLQRDQVDLPREIAGLRSRVSREDDQAVRAELDEAIRRKQEQLANLEKLQNTMEKAEYQLEVTLTALGTVYSQIQLIHAKDVDSGRAQRLRDDIADQVAALQGLQETLDEVYGSSAV
jgi:hypothetical protein